MAEEKDSPQPEEEVDTGSEDEDIWDNAPEVEDEDDPPEETEAEAEDEGEDEELEDSEEDMEDEEPAHDYEQRYKSLEKEFHKRNEASARDREDFNDLRLRSLEQDKELEKLRQGYTKPNTPPDPSDEGSFLDDDDIAYHNGTHDLYMKAGYNRRFKTIIVNNSDPSGIDDTAHKHIKDLFLKQVRYNNARR